ncbi:hypothetical protein [Amycolatopsis sp. NPDC021455]|uniref:hypothetical protein n=1 Tax=Amycolatopsis sp. NPDC021455 TaxID=3154901 RepID=UPI0034038529
MTDTAQARGRAAREKGIRAELGLAKYLRTWWPDAERAVVTGFRAGEHVSADRGDIRGTGDIVWQCKHVAALTDTQVDGILNQTRGMTLAAGAAFGVFVQRRQGKSQPGDWWAWLTLADLSQLASSGRYPLRPDRYPYQFSGRRMPPVRMLLADVVQLLIDAGYGEDDTRTRIAHSVTTTK